ncbi:cupin domain-containing protein [Teredinibacter turnerae]|uniref:cupin domain-containing protein n=1 Tax=Teredinibacter turnerae TaxID=2426 RepID=UPI0030CE4439
MSSVVSALKKANSLQDYWSPKVIADVDDAYVKVAKLKGSLAWHTHDEEDEAFFILSGRLLIQTESGDVQLEQGDFYVVPKGVAHNPIAEKECCVLLVERKSTLHTGTLITERTRSIDEQMTE